jgi:poly(beta-D-mannuronate) lyase
LRHGNSCTVAGNWFLGRGLPLTGGVRIIGEDHRVFNNYFVDLRGTDYRAALTFMLGVTNSALNEYFQVKRAEITFNTFVNCRANILIGLMGSVAGANLPPLDCVIANNLVRGTNAPLIDQRVTPLNLTWEGNLIHGASLGISQPPGITLTDPRLVLAPDGLWRPATNSLALGAAAGAYPDLVDDMDGQGRAESKDVGCDQASGEPVLRRPLGPADVGPLWMRRVGPIRSVAYASNAVTLTWDSLPALGYRVQYSSNGVNWLAVSQTVSNMTFTSSWTDNGSLTGGVPGGQGARFYRIALVP